MAVITTGGSGDWNSATPNAPWPGGTKPTTSDTVVIASGHTVTVSTNEDTWGTSPASASAAATVTDVVLTVTGTLTITSTGTLTVRGSINGTGTVNNNSTTGLVFDASSAATPGSQNYSIKMTGGSVNATGAAGARALFTSNDATGGRGFFNSGAYTTAFTYVRCYKMGKPGAAGTHLANWQGAACGGANWDHVEWDTCSRVDPTFTATRDCIMTSVTIKNATTTTDPFNARIGFTRATTGLREITNLCSDGTVWFNTDCHNLVVDGLLVGELMNNWVQFNSGTTAVNSVDASNMLVFAGNASGTHGFRLQAGGTYDKSEGWFIRPTLIESTNPEAEWFTTEYFGPFLAVQVFDDADYEKVVAQMESVAPYALTGAVIAQDRRVVEWSLNALRFAAGNFYINDKPTGAVVGQQPFGGGRASGTNDKAGAPQNLLRWTSPRSLKETLVPPTDHLYPHMR